MYTVNADSEIKLRRIIKVSNQSACKHTTFVSIKALSLLSPVVIGKEDGTFYEVVNGFKSFFLASLSSMFLWVLDAPRGYNISNYKKH